MWASSGVLAIGRLSEQIATAPDDGTRGRLPPVGKSTLQSGDPAHQLAGGALGIHDLLLQVLLAGVVPAGGQALGLALEVANQVAQAGLDPIDLFLEPDE